VAICVFIGAVEVLGLLPQELHWRGAFWNAMSGFNINQAGFIIVGLFIVTWVAAMAIWRFANVEERWGAGMKQEESLVIGTAERMLNS